MVEAEYRTLLENSYDQICSIDLNYVLLNFNHLFAEFVLSNFGKRARTGVAFGDLLAPGRIAVWLPLFQRVLDQGAFRSSFEGMDGHLFEVFLGQIRIEGKTVGISLQIRDVTARVKSEDSLRLAEQKYREIFDGAPEGIFRYALDGRCLTLNESGARMMGFDSSAEAIAAINEHGFSVWINPEDQQRYLHLMETEGQVTAFKVQQRRKDGSLCWIALTARRMTDVADKPPYYQGFVEDITEKEKLDADLKSKLRELRLVSEMNKALLHAKSEEELLNSYCRIVVEVGGYRMACVGFAEKGPEMRIAPLIFAGHEDGYFSGIEPLWDDSELGHGPAGEAVRTLQQVVVDDIATDPRMKPWRKAALDRGYRAQIAFPFTLSDSTVGIMSAYAESRGRITETERTLMEQISLQLGYGIDTLRMITEQRKFQESLNASLEQIIAVIAETIDRRDPYTAGHQRRVAELCVRIAQRLSLSECRIQGLRLAASIHDLGKIAIPLEILTYPAKLSAAQFNLLKEHSQIGYDIVRNIQFPWPIADMILQPHERLDGSGYPHGLRSEEILFESKILAVADVVEAMSSHRPYRAACGIDQALAEVTSLSGKLYEPSVVDACVELFREEGYKM